MLSSAHVDEWIKNEWIKNECIKKELSSPAGWMLSSAHVDDILKCHLYNLMSRYKGYTSSVRTSSSLTMDGVLSVE
jgi:hypothetical protein